MQPMYKNLHVLLLPIIMILGVFAVPLVFAIPTPIGIDGIIYDLDGMTPVWKDTQYSVTNLNTGETVSSSAGRGSVGRYSATIGGNNGDLLLVRAWNKYNSVNFTILASGVIHNAHFVLNMTYPPLAPVFIMKSEDVPLATEKVPFSFAIQAFDDNDDSVSFWLLEGPKGMNVNYDTGIIEWVPTNAHVGNNTFTISIFDGIHFTNETFSLEVIGVNDAPVFISMPGLEASFGQEYTYQSSAFDAESNSLLFSIVEGPSNAHINEYTGLITWKPQDSQKGESTFILQVSDGEHLAVQTFTVLVLAPKDSRENAHSSGAGGGGGGGGGAWAGGAGSGGAGKPIPGQTPSRQSPSDQNRASIDTTSLLSNEQMESILLKLKVQDVLVMPESKNSLVNILTQRPSHIKPLQSKVYRYLQIENPNQGAQPTHLISFRLEKEWLSVTAISADDISLRRYVGGVWTHLATSPVSEDDAYAYYLSETPGFSYFAIAVREGIAADYGFAPDISKIKQPYTIFGTAYSFLRVKQAQSGTPMVLENLNTSETLEFFTGIGASKGGYVGTLNGEKGQIIKVSLDGSSTLVELGDESLIVIDFIKRVFGNGYMAIERGSAAYRVVSSLFTLFLIMSISLFITVMLQRRFEKERKRTRQESQAGQKSSLMGEKKQNSQQNHQ